MLIFLTEFNMWQSHLAEKAALTCCLLGRYKAIQGPSQWLHHGSTRLGLAHREGVAPPRFPGGSQMLSPGGLPSLWSSLRRVPLRPPRPSLETLLLQASSLAAFDGGLSWQLSKQSKHGAGGWGVRQDSHSPMRASGEFSAEGSGVDSKLTGKSDSGYKYIQTSYSIVWLYIFILFWDSQLHQLVIKYSTKSPFWDVKFSVTKKQWFLKKVFPIIWTPLCHAFKKIYQWQVLEPFNVKMTVSFSRTCKIFLVRQ